jgi:hypothetical protein
MRRNYLLKHWLLTLVLAPFLPDVYMFIFKPASGQMTGLLEIYPLFLFFSLLYSLPTLLVYFIVFMLLIEQGTSPAFTKFILIALTVIGITMTILSIGGSLSSTLIFAYSLASVIAGCLLSIKSKSGTEKQLPNV